MILYIVQPHMYSVALTMGALFPFYTSGVLKNTLLNRIEFKQLIKHYYTVHFLSCRPALLQFGARFGLIH